MKTLISSVFLFTTLSGFSQSYYDKARTFFENNQLDSARFYVNKELQKKPSSDDYFLSGLIHEAEGKDLRALADYEAVVKFNPNNMEARFQKGLIYYNSASTEQAIKDFTYVIENHHRSTTNAIYFGHDPLGSKGTFVTTLQSMLGRVYQYRGLAFKKLGNNEKALEDFNQSFKYDIVADFYINRSQLFTKMGESQLAKNDLRRALELEPENYLAWYNLALIDEHAKLPDYLVHDDEFAPMLNLLGANAYERGDYVTSMRYLTKAIGNNPDDELAYLNRGKAQMKTGSFREARGDFLRALRLNQQNIEAFYLIGNSFFYEGNFEEAIGFYERYLSVDRGYMNVWYNAAMAYLSVDKLQRACACLKNAEQLGMEKATSDVKKHCDTQ